MQASALVVLVTLVAVSYVAADSNATNGTVANPEGWYLEDHPYFYNMNKVRLPNGTWVPNPVYYMPSLTAEEYYANLTAKIPFFIRWYVVGPTNKIRQGFTDFREFVIFNMVSPMDYGLSLRAQSVRRQWHEAITKFWWKMLGQYAVKKEAANLRSIVTFGISNYVASRVFERKAASYNSTDWAKEMNWTQDQIDYMRETIKEGLRVKIVTPYRYKLPLDHGQVFQQMVPAMRQAVQFFRPYTNYSEMYFDSSELLPPPTLPAAITYPWPWHQRLNQVRYIVLDVMHKESSAKKSQQEEETARKMGKDAADAAEAEANAVVTSDAGETAAPNVQESQPTQRPEKFFKDVMEMVKRRRLQASERGEDSHGSSDNGSSDGSHSSSGSGDAGNDTAQAEAVERRVKVLLREFHYATGIPRMEVMKTQYQLVVYPTLDEFNRLKMHSEGGVEGNPAQTPVEMDAPEVGVEAPTKSNTTDYETHEGVYEATKSFYSYPLMENNFTLKAAHFSLPPRPRRLLFANPFEHHDRRQDDFAQCSIEVPCNVHSAVTVYTPSLRDAAREIFSSVASVSAESQQLTRRNWLLTMFEEAFEAEKRVLKSGLQAPSTVWYSYFDRGTDIFADCVFGFVNSSKAAAEDIGQELKPLTMYETLTTNDPEADTSPLLRGSGYYGISNTHTTNAMNRSRVLPYHEPFSEVDRHYLIEFLGRQMQGLQAAIDAYELKRDADPMHRAMVNATQTRAYYDGRMFTLLGFGYLLPATNEYGVAYRDHKLPVPWHLLIRLMVRFQESRLLLQEESLQIVACLAMLQFDVRFYRCVEDIYANKSTNSTLPIPTASRRDLRLDGATDTRP